MNKKEQVCALTATSGFWCLIFAPGQPENLSFFHRNNFLGTLDFTGTDPWLNPSIFLRAQPWKIVHRQKTSNINCITTDFTFANPAPVPKFWSIPLPVQVAKPNPISPKRFANPTLYFGIPFRSLAYISTTISTLSLALILLHAMLCHIWEFCLWSCILKKFVDLRHYIWFHCSSLLSSTLFYFYNVSHSQFKMKSFMISVIFLTKVNKDFRQWETAS